MILIVTSLLIIGYNVIMDREWIGIIGRNGSGKSSACDYLNTLGFNVVSLSDVVRYHAKKQCLDMDRNTLTALANTLKTERGLAYFAEASVSHAKQEQKVVFDSIRHPLEVDYLKRHGVLFIGIDADLQDCYERIIARKKGTDFVSFDEFKAQDAYEMSGKSSGQHIDACLNQCDFRIKNNHTLGNLHTQLDDIIRNMTKDTTQ